jgi:hypothetical protein
MKKTAVFFIVTLLCMGLTVPALGAQSQTKTAKSKKPPAKQMVTEPVKPAAPQAAPQPMVPRAVPQQAQPPASQIVPQPTQPGTQPEPHPVSQPEPPVQQAAPSSAQPDARPVPQATDAARQLPPTAPEPVQMRKEVVKVNYIEAQEAFQILLAYKSARGHIQMQRNRNILIIEDTPDFVDKLLSILTELDVKPLDLMFTVDVIMAAWKRRAERKSPGRTSCSRS